MKHLLVTNDFPPKIGGIQSLLWEWWRRLPADRFAVLTSPHAGAAEFDAAQPFRVERVPEPVLLPHPVMVRRVNELGRRFGAELVVLDPAVPLGLIGPSLDLPYHVVLHGAEVTVPGRIPGTKQALGHVLRNAAHVIAAGSYPAAEAEHAAGRPLPTTVVPPGVDIERFRPLTTAEREATRRRFALPVDARLVLGVSRLVPRKGFDTAIRAVARLQATHRDVVLAIAGGGRDEQRLRRLAVELGAPVRFLGRVDNDELPFLYGCADVFAMLCRNRWGGLEQEGFGIVFVEAAACGVPQIAGDSGERRRRSPTARPASSCVAPTSRRWPSTPRWKPCGNCSTTITPGTRWGWRLASVPNASSRTTCWPPASERRWASNLPLDVNGERIIRADVALTALFAVTAAYAAIEFSTTAQWIGAVTAMTLFAIGVFAFLWSFWNAVQRSRSHDIAVSQLYLLLGPAIPSRVRRIMNLTLIAAMGDRCRHHLVPTRWARRQSRVVAGRRIPRPDAGVRTQRPVGRHLRELS